MMQNAKPGVSNADLMDILSCLDYRAGNLDRFLDDIARGFSRVLGIDWTLVTLLNSQDGCTVLGNSSRGTAQEPCVLDLHGTVTARVVESGEPYRVAGATSLAEADRLPDGFVAYLGVPLKTAAGETIGTICSFHRGPRRFTDEEVAVAQVFAARAAAAIEHHQAHSELASFKDLLEEKVAARTAQLHATQKKLIQRERLAAIGELSAKVVHEVRSPLATIGIALDHLESLALPFPSQRRLDLASRELRRLNDLLGEVLDYSRPKAGHRERLDLNVLVSDTVAVFEHLSRGQGRRTRIRCSKSDVEVPVHANPDKLRQVLINLLGNACDAAPAGSVVTVESGVAEDGLQVFVLVRNRTTQGRIDPARVCEPFFSTKAQGTGLGLAIVSGIVEALDGRFSLSQQASGEVMARVVLPVFAGVPVPSLMRDASSMAAGA